MRHLIKRIFRFVSPHFLLSFANKGFFHGFSFFCEVLLVSFLVMLLFYIPDFVSLPQYLDKQMAKFQSLSINSDFNVSSPVYFPNREGILVIDSTGLHERLNSKYFLITNKKLHYRWFKQEHSIDLGKFSNMVENKENFKMLFVLLIVFILPSLLFWAYAFLWLKYFLSILFIASVIFTVFDLTHFRKTWRQVFGVTAYASALPIFVEIVSLPIDTSYLVSFVRIAGINFYLIPFIMLFGISVVFVLLLHTAVCKSEHNG